MEDNNPSDDDVNETLVDTKLSGKKIKMNDGSSQDSNQDIATSSKDSKDENIDSGVSIDKSESTSSEDRVNGVPEVPINEVVNIAPSSSNVRAILLNFGRTRCTRNYRKRKTPGRDSDSSDSSRDSDDISAEEEPQSSRDMDNQSDGGSEDIYRFMSTISDGSPSVSNSSDTSSEASHNTNESDDMIQMNSSDTDSDVTPLAMFNDDNDEENNESKGKIPEVLLKTRPKHNYVILREIINREMGLTFPCGKTTKSDVMFEQKFYSSLHSVYRMNKLHQLNKHRGCVNTINFHPEGHLLASGSDDTNVIVWDWARNKALQSIRTGHKSNVFQSKFLYLNAMSQLNIVTCARDGQVRLVQCGPAGASGRGAARRRLAAHARAAHKLHVCREEPHAVTSVGEDGLAILSDVRTDTPNRLFQVKVAGTHLPLYSVSGHPLDPNQLVVAGKDKFVRLYDRRKATKPVSMYCPKSFQEPANTTRKKVQQALMHLTCAIYNHDGSQILGSYNDEDIYLFDVAKDAYDIDNTNEEELGYTHRYSGHRNSATVKGVSFFGPKSEYIVSGSDCSNIYIWEKETEAVVQWMHGDEGGVVNCIEAHPRCPILATSGLDKDVKIWIPKSQTDPDYSGFEKVVKQNSLLGNGRSPLFNDFLPTLYSAWRGEHRLMTDDGNSAQLNGGNMDFDGNACAAF